MGILNERQWHFWREVYYSCVIVIHAERMIYDNARHLKKCCVNPVRKKWQLSDQEAGEDGYGS